MKFLSMMILLLGFSYGQTAEALVAKHGCMACHALQGKKSAPAFRGIARRNTKTLGQMARQTIIQSIKQGSQGKYPRYTSQVMPAFSQLSQSELETIADWILGLAPVKRGTGMYQGRGMNRGIQ